MYTGKRNFSFEIQRKIEPVSINKLEFINFISVFNVKKCRERDPQNSYKLVTNNK